MGSDSETGHPPSMRAAMITQAFGMLVILMFFNGVLLAYCQRLGISSNHTLIILALPNAVSILSVFFAHFGDRRGLKRMGWGGIAATCMGLLVFIVAPLLPINAKWSVGLGALLCGLGSAVYASTWFALVSSVVPVSKRGRFFGLLRLIWQTVALVFGLLVAAFLAGRDSIEAYQWIFGFLLLGMIPRVYYYHKIVDHSTRDAQNERHSFRSAVGHLMETPGYVSFTSYVVLLALYAGSMPLIFGLLQKDVLLLEDRDLVLMGNVLFLGSIFGFLLGGRIIDQFGTKSVFLICHFGLAVALLGIVFREALPCSAVWTTGFWILVYGGLNATSGLSITTETLAVSPKENLALATTLLGSLGTAASFASSFAISRVLDTSMLAEQWQWMGLAMSQYDSILLLAAFLICCASVTLGLVPSVVRPKAQWIPQGRGL